MRENASSWFQVLTRPPTVRYEPTAFRTLEFLWHSVWVDALRSWWDFFSSLDISLRLIFPCFGRIHFKVLRFFDFSSSSNPAVILGRFKNGNTRKYKLPDHSLLQTLTQTRCWGRNVVFPLSHSSLLLSSSHKKPRMLAAHSSSAVIYPVESAPVLGGCINCCAQRFGRPPTMWGRCTPITLHAPCITLEPPLNYSRDPILLQIAVGPPPSPRTFSVIIQT